MLAFSHHILSFKPTPSGKQDGFYIQAFKGSSENLSRIALEP